MAAKKAAQTSEVEKPAELLIVDGVLDIDETAEVIPFNYAITAYGADPQVDGLIKRMKEGDIFIPRFSLAAAATPRFQREYVWNKPQADRFIESLLLGLPVPGIFLVKEESGRHLVLDGHQRLYTLQAYYKGSIHEEVYRLANVQERFEGKRYEELDTEDRSRIDERIINATITLHD